MKIDRLNILMTNYCNSQKLPNAKGSPGVCKFCYRQENIINSTKKDIDRIIDRVIEHGKIKEIVFTGGEPLLSKELLYFMKKIYALDIETSIHTNGILLQKRIKTLSKYLTNVFLPIDGSVPEVSEYHRGVGFHDLFIKNVELVKKFKLNLGIFTFVSKRNFDNLNDLSKMISKLKPKYWLISGFKRINKSRNILCEEYNVNLKELYLKVKKIAKKYPNLEIISEDPFTIDKAPRLFVQSDAKVYTDIKSVPKNVYLGTLHEHDLKYFETLMSRLKLIDRKNKKLTKGLCKENHIEYISCKNPSAKLIEKLQ